MVSLDVRPLQRFVIACMAGVMSPEPQVSPAQRVNYNGRGRNQVSLVCLNEGSTTYSTEEGRAIDASKMSEEAMCRSLVLLTLCRHTR